MCIVSNIGNNYQDNFFQKWPNIPPAPSYPIPQVSREEFNALRNEVKELKKLLEAAKEFDRKTGQKDCEMDNKVEFIKMIAKAVGVDLRDVFKNE